MPAGQRVETFTQKSFLFYDAAGKFLGIRTVNRIADTLPKWLDACHVRLSGLSPLFIAEPVIASPARVEGLLPLMLDPDTGRRGELPKGYNPDSVEEHSTVVTVFGDIVATDDRMPVQHVAMFTQLDYSFVDRATGQTLATRQHGRIASAIEAWAEANLITIRGLGHLYIRNPPVVTPYESLNQSRLVNPRTRKMEPYVVENPDQVTVLEYMTIQPVFGDKRAVEPKKKEKPNVPDAPAAEHGEGG